MNHVHDLKGHGADRHDPVAMGELVLTACLMIAANTSESRLSQHAIDTALGLRRRLRVAA